MKFICFNKFCKFSLTIKFLVQNYYYRMRMIIIMGIKLIITLKINT